MFSDGNGSCRMSQAAEREGELRLARRRGAQLAERTDLAELVLAEMAEPL